MRAGLLRHRVTVQARKAGYDGAGQPTDEWVDVTPAWARVEPLRGGQLFSAREAGMEATHRVTLRWTPKLRVDGRWQVDRIVHGGRHLYPEAPPMEDEEGRERVEVLVTERTDPTEEEPES